MGGVGFVVVWGGGAGRERRAAVARRVVEKTDAGGGKRGGKDETRRQKDETKARISAALAGRKKSEAMKAKVSQALKGRVPWNKGKKLAAETRKRMSTGRSGIAPWNKGTQLSETHRKKISEKMTGRVVSAETREKLKRARRRPGDRVIAGSKSTEQDDDGEFALVDTVHIHEFVSLRRELRGWSEEFVDRVGRRPSISDVRRLAPLRVAQKFEQYLRLRDRIRGLAKEVYGVVDMEGIPAEAPRKVEPRVIRVERTKPGEVVPAIGPEDPEGDEAAGHGKALSKSDYQLLGRYRLMESKDIHAFIQLQKDLKKFSKKFKAREGRVPRLSDLKEKEEHRTLYGQFVRYLDMRTRIHGLVHEVYGLDLDNIEEIEQVSERGQRILEQLRQTEDRLSGDATTAEPTTAKPLASGYGEDPLRL